jgi:hypothetical protein
MEDSSDANAIRVPRVWPRGGLSLRLQAPPLDWLSIALIVLLAVTWLSEGGAALAGVSPRWAGRVVQLGETVLVIWLAVRLLRERRFRLLLPLAVYGAWVATGLINSHAPFGEQTTALRYWLIVPALGALLAFDGGSEGRARAVIVTLFALTAFEFLVTIVQLLVVPYAAHDADLIVGSFGKFDGAVIGIVVVLLACVSFGGYLINARAGKQALAASVILTLVSGWAVVKLATILLPVVFVMTALTALLLRLTDRRRALTGIIAALVASAAVVGSYAVFKPSSLTALNPAGGLGSYVTNGSVAGGLTRAQSGGMVLEDYWNAVITSRSLPLASGVPRTRGFRIFSIRGGAYTAAVSKPGTVSWPARPGGAYRFSVGLVDATRIGQVAVPEIEWRSSRLLRLGNSVARPVGLTDHRGTVATVAGFAPPGAAFAIPKIAVFGRVPAGASIYAWSPRLQAIPPQAVAGPTEASIGKTMMGAFWNAGIEHQRLAPVRSGAPPRLGFRIANLSPGDYTAFLEEQNDAPLKVVAGRAYLFAADVANLTPGQAFVESQIDWRTSLSAVRDRSRGILGTTFGFLRPLRPISAGTTRLVVIGVAPAGTHFAVPKLAITGHPPAGSVMVAYRPVFGETSRAARSGIGRTRRIGPRGAVPAPSQPATRGHRTRPAPPRTSPRHPRRAGHPVSPPPGPHSPRAHAHHGGGKPAPVVGLLPGHYDLLKTAMTGVSDAGVTHALFGFGLGSAGSGRLAHVVDAAHLTPQQAGSYSDLGTLVVERGWSGVVVVALLAVFLVILGFRLSARSAGVGGWATAFRLAVPGAILTLAVYALIGDFLQTYSSALTFWIIIGLGLGAMRSDPASPRGGP